MIYEIPASDSDGTWYLAEFDVSPFVGPNMTVAYNLVSDASANSFGANITWFWIETLTLNTTTYGVINGTSMATPHVAGLAAMVAAYNPQYTYRDVVAALKNGGLPQSSRSGNTSTGNAVHGLGALTYISPPTGVTVTKP